MATMYKILFKIEEVGKSISGIRIVDKPIDEYMVFIRKTHPDALSVYVELIEQYEQADEPDEADEGSIILLGWTQDIYDAFLP